MSPRVSQWNSLSISFHMPYNSPNSHEVTPTNISCFSFHALHMHTNIQANKIITYFIIILSFQSHSNIHVKHSHILWVRKRINTSIEPHQPTQQPLSRILAQAKGPQLGEWVLFAQATPSRLGESYASLRRQRFA